MSRVSKPSMWHSSWLAVGTGTLAVGTAVALAFPSSPPLAVAAASALGAAGGALVAESQRRHGAGALSSEISSEILAKLTALEHSHAQILTELQRLGNPLPKRAKASPVPTAVDAPFRVLPAPMDLGAVERVAAWLAPRQIAVRGYRVPTAEDGVLDEIAWHLGQNYRYLEKFYQQIKKSSIDRGRKFVFNLSGIPEVERQAIQDFCWALRTNPYWQSRYVSAREQMEVMPITSPILCNFLEGGWLESFVAQQVQGWFTQNGWEHVGGRGLQVTFPEPLAEGQQNFELDCFWLVAGQPLWLECKVGLNYKQALSRYAQQRLVLGLSKAHSFLVLTDITPEEALGYTPLGEITLVSIDRLVAQVAAVWPYPDTPIDGAS